jgi:hypothetical protein
MEDALSNLLILVADRFPFALAIVSVIGTSRVVVRTARWAIEKFIAETPSTADNEWYERQKPKAWYRALAWWADTTFSVKLPKKPAVADPAK